VRSENPAKADGNDTLNRLVERVLLIYSLTPYPAEFRCPILKINTASRWAMVFNIVRMRVKGVPLTPAELSKATPVRADISIQHESNIMGRSSVVAQLRFPPNNLQWPELLDCQLHSMAPGGMVLTGTEIIDGVVYGQSWLCRD